MLTKLFSAWVVPSGVLLLGLSLSSSAAKAQESASNPSENTEGNVVEPPLPPYPQPPDGSGGNGNGSRRPVRVEKRSSSNIPLAGNMGTVPGTKIWGHQTTYVLQVIDNFGGFYGRGKPHEMFPKNSLHQYYPDRKKLQWGTGTEATWPQSSVFNDYNSAWLTYDTGASRKWYDFKQTWQIFEDGKKWPNLNTHTITHYQDHATRG